MTLFWLCAAALAVVALIVLLRPFLRRREGGDGVSREAANVSIYRDQLRELEADLAAGTLAQADYERSRREIEARVLQDVPAAASAAVRGGRGAALAVGIALPLLGAALYLAVGMPGSMGTGTAEHFTVAVGRLAAHLRENPDDGEGWKLLGRSYVALGRFNDAVEAYTRATARFPRDAQLLADFADAFAMARGRTLGGEPEKLILRALELDPENLKALALAGTVAFDRGDYAGAAAYWKRMAPLVPPGSEDARTVAANVAEAQRLAGENTAASSPSGIKGKVALAPAVREAAKPEDVVFIFARAAEGPPMPLAVMRARVKELPLAFALDDSMAMAPGLALSKFPKVVVTARVSRSGQPTAQSGDLQGASAPVANDAKNVSIVIDTVVK
ncbi:MAG: c-type cytochrome biogenesis protein CcmI [Betaproteobacteria bacterium]